MTVLSFSSKQLTTKRESKGKSLLEAVQNYTAIDIETTGYDPGYDRIVEVGAVRVQNGNVVSDFQSLVHLDGKLDAFLIDKTGITNEMLSDAQPLSIVLPEFIKFIGNDTVVAHNANFDINFIYDNCIELLETGFKNDFIDTLRLSRRMFTEHTHHSLDDLLSRFNLEKRTKHRSVSDSIMAHQCYEYMKKYASDNGIDISSLYPSKHLSANDVQTSKTEFDTSTAIYGKLFVFTGTLEKMLRKEAMQIVVDMGGTCGDSVTKKTDFLVLGNNDYCSTIKDGKSSKQKKAESLMLSGVNIQVISENVFYDMVFEE